MQQSLFRRMAILTTGSTLIISYLWILMFQQNETLLFAGGVVFQLVAFLTGTCYLIAVYRQTAGYMKRTWLFLGLGGIAYLLGQAGYLYKPLFLQAPRSAVGWPDYFWMMQTFFYLLAILRIIVKNIHIYKSIRLVVDILIVMTAATSISWHYIIKPVIQRIENADIWVLTVKLIYPIADLGIVCGIIGIFLMSQRIFPVRTLVLLGSGMLVQVAADTLYLLQTVAGTYTLGGYLDPLWVLVLQLFGLAGLYDREETHAEKLEEEKQRTAGTWIGEISRLVIPYLFVMILFYLAIYSAGKADVIVIGSLICIVLIIIRQITILIENQSLLKKMQQMTEELEQVVTERTDQLYKKNIELAATLEQMEYMEYHDSLSGLPNRGLFEDRLANSIARAQRSGDKVAVLLLDLDRFKNVNDNLGHSFGDKLLIHTAAKLHGQLEQCDTICRLGGDEFAILLEGFAETQHITEIVEGLIYSFNQPLQLEKQELHLTASIGIAVYPYDGMEAETLIQHAETAMYRVKKAGKNHYQFFDPTMADSSRFELEHALRKALERGEFVVYYQPRVSMQNGRIVGMEALLRWQRPDYGVVPPGDFIPLAEETGLIIPLGEWVLRTACLQAKRWHDEGLSPLRVAVNLSGLQFKQVDLVEMIKRILAESQLPPRYLELEITESVALLDVETAIEKLNSLKQMGVEISLDDFGTGYSSLRYLGQFPIDTLKIDRSFVNGITHNAHHAAIVTAIAALGHSLQLKVLAEGVEKEEQLHVLREIGCQEVQGFYYSPPVPAERFRQLLA